MKIGLYFIGLERTIKKTYENLYYNIINTKYSYDINFVTWKNESTKDFKDCFPESKIIFIEKIDINSKQFKDWKKGLQMHESWLEKYKANNDDALFNYYRQIYLWKEASRYLERKTYDLVIRCRTDIIMNGILPPKFQFNNISPNTVYFPNEPRHGAFGNSYEGCPDYFMFGRQDVMMKTLSIIDYVNKYKYGENNIVHAESTLYLFLKGENIKIEFLSFNIEIVR
jgi:hypothetical protein